MKDFFQMTANDLVQYLNDTLMGAPAPDTTKQAYRLVKGTVTGIKGAQSGEVGFIVDRGTEYTNFNGLSVYWAAHPEELFTILWGRDRNTDNQGNIGYTFRRFKCHLAPSVDKNATIAEMVEKAKADYEVWEREWESRRRK